jgi:hypothetical protein
MRANQGPVSYGEGGTGLKLVWTKYTSRKRCTGNKEVAKNGSWRGMPTLPISTHVLMEED